MVTSSLLGTWHSAVPGSLNRLRQFLGNLVHQTANLWSYEETKTPLTSSQQVSILFTDIVGFSHLMTAYPLEMVVSSLNRYFEQLSRCVYRHGGQVDKFIGDGMMAVFDSPDDAVSAAHAIQREVARCNSQQTGEAGCTFPTRIVVDTGLVVKTAIGLHRDRDWTVIGPVVNTASHLAKTLPPDKVFISHSTCCHLANRSDLRLTEPQAIVGCKGELIIYEATA